MKQEAIKTIEIHLFNFNKNIYDYYLTVKVLYKIRNEVKFPSIEKLKIQISRDIKIAQNLLNKD